MIEIKISGNTAEEVKSKVISLFNQLTAATEAYEQTKQVAPKKATTKEKAPAKETKPAKSEPVVDTVSIEVPAEPENRKSLHHRNKRQKMLKPTPLMKYVRPLKSFYWPTQKNANLY